MTKAYEYKYVFSGTVSITSVSGSLVIRCFVGARPYKFFVGEITTKFNHLKTDTNVFVYVSLKNPFDRKANVHMWDGETDEPTAASCTHISQDWSVHHIENIPS